MKDADRKQAEMIWEHLVNRLRVLENQNPPATWEASGPDHQAAKKPNAAAPRGQKPGESADSDWDMQA